MARPRNKNTTQPLVKNISDAPKIKLVEVNITRKYFDISEGKEILPNVIFITSEERAKQLFNAKVGEIRSIKK